MSERDRNSEDTTLITTVECAARKGVTRQSIHDAIKRGALPAMRIGRDYLVKVADCEAYQPTRTPAERGARNAGKPKTRKKKPAAGEGDAS